VEEDAVVGRDERGREGRDGGEKMKDLLPPFLFGFLSSLPLVPLALLVPVLCVE